MSRRLVAGFVLVVVVLTAASMAAYSYSVGGLLRAEQGRQVADAAALCAALVDDRIADGRPVTEAQLGEIVGRTQMVSVEVGERTVSAAGPGFDRGADGSADVRATARGERARVTVTESSASWGMLLGSGVETVATILALVALAAVVAGWVVARRVARPYTTLATAAGMLGRGRFDLDLPRSRAPDVRAVSAALEASARALQDRLGREQQFSVHVSHVLRTPLTSLRLNLDELATHDLDPEAAASAARCQERVDTLDQVVDDLVAITRRGALMSGAEVPLRELAGVVAQRWADGLAGTDRSFSAAVEGDLDLTLTPGPLEYVLDVLLEQALQEQPPLEDVRLVVDGTRPVVRVEVTGLDVDLDAASRADAAGRLAQAQSLVLALGGRVERLPQGPGVRVLLPPR